MHFKSKQSLYFFFVIIFIPCLTFGQDYLSANAYSVGGGSIARLHVNDETKTTTDMASKNGGAKINYWVTTGAFLMGGFGDLNINKSFNMLTIHIVGNSGNPFDFDNPGPRKPEWEEYGVLYGIVLTDKNQKINMSFSIGCSRLSYRKEVYIDLAGEYMEQQGVVYGYPVIAGLLYHGKYFGVGFNVLFNHNEIEDFCKFSPCISIGKLR
ncbi:MAG: hypothetical protein Q7U87_00465 [bacterium]|nr:hypothetical protein [bacterium]